MGYLAVAGRRRHRLQGQLPGGGGCSLAWRLVLGLERKLQLQRRRERERELERELEREREREQQQELERAQEGERREWALQWAQAIAS